MKDDYILSSCCGCESCSHRYDCDIFHWFIRVGKRCHIAQSLRLLDGYRVPACYSGVGMAVEFCSSTEWLLCMPTKCCSVTRPTNTATSYWLQFMDGLVFISEIIQFLVDSSSDIWARSSAVLFIIYSFLVLPPPPCLRFKRIASWSDTTSLLIHWLYG